MVSNLKVIKYIVLSIIELVYIYVIIDLSWVTNIRHGYEEIVFFVLIGMNIVIVLVILMIFYMIKKIILRKIYLDGLK